MGEAPASSKLDRLLARLRAHLPELRERYGVSTLGVFGSYVRQEERGASDLDVLVDFQEVPTLLELAALQRYLGDLVGIKVDLVLRRTLKPAIGEVILSEVVYA